MPTPIGFRRRTSAEFLDELLGSYDRFTHPNYYSKLPTNISINLFVNSIDSIESGTMDYKINVFLRMKWIDKRLRFTQQDSSEPVLNVHPSMYEKLWVPDLIFSNEKVGNFHTLTTDNRLLQLSRNGQVYTSIRISLTLGCFMDFHLFPLDMQTCPIQMESFGYSMDTLQFNWQEKGAIQLNDNIVLPQFKIKGFKLEDCTKVYSSGKFTCKEGQFIMQRQLGYYLVQMYVPTVLVVWLSWISFWIDINAAPARTSLGVTTVLTITQQAQSSANEVPKLSYIKGIDYWMTTCMIFVFAALLEYAIVQWISRKDKDSAFYKRKIQEIRAKNDPNGEFTSQFDKLNACLQSSVLSLIPGVSRISAYIQRHFEFVFLNNEEPDQKKFYQEFAIMIDKRAQVLFPLAFALFTLLYWSVLFASEEAAEQVLEGAVPYVAKYEMK